METASGREGGLGAEGKGGLGGDTGHPPNTPKRPISIVVPAHNEAPVIARALDALTCGARPGEIDIVVVCNGCHDDSAQIAGSWGDPVRVVETTTASKPKALNLGDAAAGSSFPRFYVDADVVIACESIRRLAARLEQGDVYAVGPSARLDLTGCARLVRWFYQVALLLPSAGEGIGGSGVYGLSRAGHRRFGKFPDLVADDGFVRLLFEAAETATLSSATAQVFPPRRLASLIRARARVRYGHLELARHFPARWRRRQGNGPGLLALFARPRLWPKLFVYTAIVLTARGLAARRFRAGTKKWEHDLTSRSAVPRKVFSQDV